MTVNFLDKTCQVSETVAYELYGWILSQKWAHLDNKAKKNSREYGVA